MNTLLTIRISKRKTIQLTIDEARQLQMQLNEWLVNATTTEREPISERECATTPKIKSLWDKPFPEAMGEVMRKLTTTEHATTTEREPISERNTWSVPIHKAQFDEPKLDAGI